ncbi:Rrf2 family transcriptional regulator [Agrobacterium pusense]|uniref:Rrf2 family transcriptional regulator n=1 Tax=Agrobacterium pusense TaxID=648995 RepID=UPI003FD5B116
MRDVRFPTAVQVMLALTLAREEGVSQLNSAELAEGAATNAAVIRRMLPSLSAAGLIEVAKGREGGVQLARPPETISLADIYDAIFGDEPLWHARENIPHRCLVSNNVEAFFAGVTQDAEKAMRTQLSTRSLATCLIELRAAEAASTLQEQG